MTSHYVEYPLHNGFVHNWLVAGPQAIAITPARLIKHSSQNGTATRAFKHQLFQHYFSAKSAIGATPVERGPLDAGRFTIGKYTASWSYVPCPEDHTVDHSDFYPSCHYLRSWAYVEVVSQRQQRVLVEVSTYGAVDLWTEGNHLFRAETATHPSGERAATHTTPLQLKQGVTPLLVRFENAGMGQLPHAMSLRFCRERVVSPQENQENNEKQTPAEGIHVRFRTLMPLARRNAFEKLSVAAYVERDVYEGDTPITLRWPPSPPQSPRANCFAHVRLQTPDQRIYLAGDSAGAPGDTLQLGYALQLPAGPLQTTLMPNPNEVYLEHLRILQTLPLWSMGQQRYHATPWGDLAERRNQALLAAVPIEDSVFAQIARMAWGAWPDVDSKPLLTAIARVQRHEEGSNLLLLGLLGLLYRWGEQPHFPAEVRQPLEACILGYRYWQDVAHADHTPVCTMDFRSGSNPLLFHACELLAGQLYPDRLFADQRTGEWHRARGEELTKQWVADYGALGMASWNSPASMEQVVAALTHVVDLAEAEEVYELAAVALDKLFFTLALNSLCGVLGVAAQSQSASIVKSGLLQPTSPICNLMWGMGIYNHHIAGVVSLACSANYQMPAMFQTIAQAIPEELWSREQHAPAHAAAANIVTYKTPDFILSSLQDYMPGQHGQQEAVWRVTLGAEAVIFANHPASSTESDSRSPGYWSGNERLPRVAQWKDALVAIHQLMPDDPLNFTHAYFPTATFDEYELRAGWAFARRGDGYVALTNSQGFAMTQQGRYALRELRASGTSQIWLVQMGRAALDGNFATFQAKVLALPIHYADETVAYTTLRGDTLRFAWHGSLLVNGETQPLDGFKHYDNVYTKTELSSGQMEIQWAEDGLRLDLG